MATQSDLRANEILKKLTEGILGAKTFADIPKWEVEGGPVPRTFFSDRLKRNTNMPINDEAVLWLVKLYSAQLGIFLMREPISEAKSVSIANGLLDYLSDITGMDLAALRNSYSDSDASKKRKVLVDILTVVLNSMVDKENLDPSVVASDIANQIQSFLDSGDVDALIKMACVSEVYSKCPFCKHDLIDEIGGQTIEEYRIIKFPMTGRSGQFEYIAVCNNCYEKYKDTSNDAVIRSLNDKKKTIIVKKSFDKSVDALEMEKEISQVLEALSVADPTELPAFQYTPVKVRQKIPNDRMLFSKVWSNVVQYFPFVEDKLKQLNNERRLTYEKISGDVKRAYLEFATNETNKEVIFNQLCEWLAQKAQTDKKTACEAIISYYVQNCEVFERETTE